MLIDKIRQDLNETLKAKDEVSVSTLRMVIANINNAKIKKGSDLSDDEVISEIGRDAKRHKESITAFEKGSRADLAEKEKAELVVLSKYLPEQMSDEDLTKMVVEAISAVEAKTIADMGRVVGAVMSGAGARADGAKVAEIARLKLAAGSK